MQDPRDPPPEDQILYESPIEGEYWELEEFLHEGRPAWRVIRIPSGVSDFINEIAFQPVYWDDFSDISMHLDRHNKVIEHHMNAADKPKWSTNPHQHKAKGVD